MNSLKEIDLNDVRHELTSISSILKTVHSIASTQTLSPDESELFEIVLKRLTSLLEKLDQEELSNDN